MQASSSPMAMSAIILLICLIIVLTNAISRDVQPHIIFIVADDMGYNDVGWRNPHVISPHIDKLAKSGVILEQSYMMPLCTPSRSALMTGLHPILTGMQHDVLGEGVPYGLPINIPILPQQLKQAGYETHIVGKWHLGCCNMSYIPTARGFDSFYGYFNGREHYFTHQYEGFDTDGLDFWNATANELKPVVDQNGTYSTISFVNRVAEILQRRDKNQPLFLYLPFQSCHYPLEVPAKFLDLYPDVQDQDRRIYLAMVSALDEAVGNVTRLLRKAGITPDNSVLIFTSDNGGPPDSGANNWPLRGAKSTVWEGGTRVAAFVNSNLLGRKGITSSNLMHATDWYATIMQLAGLKVPAPRSSLYGVDQWDAISNGAASPRRELVYNIDPYGQANCLNSSSAALRIGKWKLIVGCIGTFNDWYPERGPDVPKESAMINSFGMLFDLRSDPSERIDVATARPDMVAKLMSRLTQIRKWCVQPLNFPGMVPSPAANPRLWNDTWSPGYC